MSPNTNFTFYQNSKESVSDLAILGASPAFKEKLCVGKPNIGDRRKFFDHLERMFESGVLSNQGPFVQEFEEEICKLVETKHCVATCNATIALEVLLRALGIEGEVIVPAFTFIATAHAPQWLGIQPVFCDIEPENFCLDPQRVEESITPKTQAILGVHLWGRPSNVELLQKIADRHGLRLIFDAAHALFCSYKGEMIGGFGDAEVFSFHATKFINTLEGGAITTNSDALADKLRLMRNFGFAGFDNVVSIGTNAKMNEASAAMGLTNLESLSEIVKKNHDNYCAYLKFLNGVPGIRLLCYDESEKHNYQYVIVEVDESESGISRDLLIECLWAENVIARRYFYPGCHRMAPYNQKKQPKFPVTESLCGSAMALPTGTSVTKDQIQVICNIVRAVVQGGDRLSSYTPKAA